MGSRIACTHMGQWPEGLACRECYLAAQNDATRFTELKDAVIRYFEAQQLMEKLQREILG